MDREGSNRKIKSRAIIKKLRALSLSEATELKWRTPWQLLVAVELSAQCTDKRVNEVTKKLFKKHPRVEDYLKISQKQLEKKIFSTGFYKSKAKNILSAARIIQKKHRGRVPSTMKDLLSIPGVGRKTANVVLGNAYGVVEGIAVDTHVKRLARILGLTASDKVGIIEKDLMACVDKKDWFNISNLLISYGRKYCPARRHNHAQCPLVAFHTS